MRFSNRPFANSRFDSKNDSFLRRVWRY